VTRDPSTGILPSYLDQYCGLSLRACLTSVGFRSSPITCHVYTVYSFGGHMLFISNRHQTHGHILEMAFPVLRAVSCLSPPILGANERLMHKGIFIALIALPLLLVDNRGEVRGRLGLASVILSPYYFLRKSPTHGPFRLSGPTVVRCECG
jgi:hypothetical protein